MTKLSTEVSRETRARAPAAPRPRTPTISLGTSSVFTAPPGPVSFYAGEPYPVHNNRCLRGVGVINPRGRNTLLGGYVLVEQSRKGHNLSTARDRRPLRHLRRGEAQKWH
ncbi:hypothetical protein EVAR_99383_1 [Eumeta japonica]|uniref:Uncharacterized protein n=1 Tax=Eumeta variegata TaxID=151549 RepID=A0A4C1YRT7_EUMVA|nr:hypothetical protein EVAR_99383_1 [Eumeta japonica]